MTETKDNNLKVTEIVLPSVNTLKIEKETDSQSIFISFRKFEEYSDSAVCNDYFEKSKGFIAETREYPHMRVTSVIADTVYKICSNESDREGNRSYITIMVSGIKEGFKISDHALIKFPDTSPDLHLDEKHVYEKEVGEKVDEKLKNFGPIAVFVNDNSEEQEQNILIDEYRCVTPYCVDKSSQQPFYKIPGRCNHCDRNLQKQMTVVSRIMVTAKSESIAVFRPLN